MGERGRFSSLSAVVLKTFGVFGSAECMTMLCGVVRTKLVALWVGAAGVGLFGLLNSVVEMIGSFSQAGLRSSAVRQIASRFPGPLCDLSVFVARRLGMIVGVLSGVLCAALSGVLSMISFGDTGYWWAFCWLGVAIALNSVMTMESAVLQSLHKLKQIAQASVTGSVLALCVSVPLLYVWRMDGVVPVILAYSLCIFGAYMYQGRRSCPAKPMDKRNGYVESRNDMLRLGAFLTVSGFVSWCVNYVLMSYINHYGGEVQLGYFQSGYTIVIRYMGVAFSAIGMEFFPRLSRAATRGARRSCVFVNHEIYVILCIVVPMGCLLAAFAPWVVQLLYSKEFMPAVPYIVFAMLGCVWRCVSWCIAYMVVANGSGWLYVMLESGSCAVCLALSLPGYLLFGLAGLGWAFAVWFLVYFIMVYAVARKRYGYRMPAVTVWSVAASMAAIAVVVWLSVCVAMWSAVAWAVFVSAVCVWRLLRRR